MTTTIRSEPARTCSVPCDDDLLAQVLRPYRDHCKYLTSAEIIVPADRAEREGVSAAGRFTIPESCYIDDTGHFNSVELNICYNQMLYYLLAKSVQDQSLAVFDGWRLDDFWERQLPNVLIAEFRSVFKRQMSGRSFEAEMDIVSASYWQATDIQDAVIALQTRCRFRDSLGGNCQAEVRVVVTDPVALGTR